MRFSLLLVLAAAMADARADDFGQRRAIRDGLVPEAQESEALRAMRELEERAFPPPARGEVAAATAAAPWPWLAQLKIPRDLALRFDARVLGFLSLYRDDRRGRAIISSWLRGSGRFATLIDEALRRHGLPSWLVYVAMIESGFDPHDASHKGAVGLWQLMPEGARIYGLRIDHWVDERKDPERATEAAMRYLTDLKLRFGAWPLALAAFNAGYGAVLRSMQKYNTNDYWELSRHENGLPWETVQYVPKLMAAALVGENRAVFGLGDVKPEAPWAYERVMVARPLALAEVARAAGVSLADVVALNPELRRRRIPPDIGGARWPLRLPPGSAARFAAAEHVEAENVRAYVVRFGERLDDIARAHGISVARLKSLNALENGDEIRAGLTLVTPAVAAPRPLAGDKQCDAVVVAVPDKDAAAPGRKRVFYRTLPSDSVGEIAQVFGVQPAEIETWNRLDADARLAGGITLQLWVGDGFDGSGVVLVPAARVRLVTVGSDEFFDLAEARRGRVRVTYVARAGEDLATIGKHFGLTRADMERINHARGHVGPAPLKAGQKLIVYRAMTDVEKARVACVAPGAPAPDIGWPPEEDPAPTPLMTTPPATGVSVSAEP